MIRSRLRGVSAGWISAMRRRKAARAEGRNDFTASARLWRQLAQEGDPEACHRLGDAYERGRGVIQNFTDAVQWYRRAADKAWVPATAKLGEIYFFGRKMPGSIQPADIPDR